MYVIAVHCVVVGMFYLFAAFLNSAAIPYTMKLIHAYTKPKVKTVVCCSPKEMSKIITQSNE